MISTLENSIRWIVVFISTLLMVCTSWSQPSMEMPSEPGKCYAKCLMQDIYSYEYEYEYFYRYRGDNPFQEGVEEVSFIFKDSKPIWVKKERGDCCFPKNSRAVAVYCIEGEIPEETDEYFEVVDTHRIKDFVLDSVEFEVPKLIQKAYFEWKEIVCEADIDESLYQEIQSTLVENGYDIGAHGVNGNMNDKTKAALVKYQKDNQLPIGALDIETLASLGIKI